VPSLEMIHNPDSDEEFEEYNDGFIDEGNFNNLYNFSLESKSTLMF
jgi:hypothetical protein